MLGTRVWHLTVISAVKVFVQKQSAFMAETYASVLDALQNPTQPSDSEDSSSEDSCNEECTDVYETGSLPYRGTNEDGTVIFDDDVGSEDSDKSAYDVSHASSLYYPPSRSRMSPEARMSPMQDPSRCVAESSLEPLEYSEAEESPDPLSLFSDGDERKGDCWDAQLNDSELDTGEHHSIARSASPAPAGRHISHTPVTRQRMEHVPASATEGIPFIRWATRLGRRGKEILTESTVAVQVISPVHQNLILIRS